MTNNQLDHDLYNFISEEKVTDSWPEEFPGITRFPDAYTSINLEFDANDIILVNQLGNLAPGALIDEIKAIQSIACKLSIEEDQEILRGKILRVLLD